MLGWFRNKKQDARDDPAEVCRRNFNGDMARYFAALGQDSSRFRTIDQIGVMVENEILLAFQTFTGKVSLADEGVTLDQQVAAMVMAALGCRSLGMLVFEEEPGMFGSGQTEAATGLTMFSLLREDVQNPSPKALEILGVAETRYPPMMRSDTEIMDEVGNLFVMRLSGYDVSELMAQAYDMMVDMVVVSGNA